jgi:hypothetical protein
MSVATLDQLLASPGAAVKQLYAAAGSPQADASFDLAGALQSVFQDPSEWRSKVALAIAAAGCPFYARARSPRGPAHHVRRSPR